MRVKRCFSFSDTNNSVVLVDSRGCSDRAVISDFEYSSDGSGSADATIFSMFKFPESSRVHFQCDVVVCRRARCKPHVSAGLCALNAGEGNVVGGNGSRVVFGGPDAFSQPPDDGALLASYSVFVVEPGAEYGKLNSVMKVHSSSFTFYSCASYFCCYVSPCLTPSEPHLAF